MFLFIIIVLVITIIIVVIDSLLKIVIDDIGTIGLDIDASWFSGFRQTSSVSAN